MSSKNARYFFLSLIFLCCLSNPLLSHAAKQPLVKVVDSKNITLNMLTNRVRNKGWLVERQISRIKSTKDGGWGIVINDKKQFKTYYYGQIKGLKNGYYVTTYYFYNPYTNDVDDAVIWYSFVTKKANGAHLKVLASKDLTRKKLKSSAKDHTIYVEKILKKRPRSVTYKIYNPFTGKAHPIDDVATFAY